MLGRRGEKTENVPVIVCRFRLLGDFYHSSDVLEARWHPLSLTHVCVLTSDGVFRYVAVVGDGGAC